MEEESDYKHRRRLESSRYSSRGDIETRSLFLHEAEAIAAAAAVASAVVAALSVRLVRSRIGSGSRSETSDHSSSSSSNGLLSSRGLRTRIALS